ncbi:MAG: allophanate hydrolase, partial [Gammaproteobacteria bacterium]
DEVAALLYEGPWVAERAAAIGPFLSVHANSLHPVVASIIAGAERWSAVDAFQGMYRLAKLTREASGLFDTVDILAVPTAPIHVRIESMLADPIILNSRLGRYTNFVNLLDWSAIAVPAGLRDDALPFGITFIGPAWHDLLLCEWASRWQARKTPPLA